MTPRLAPGQLNAASRASALADLGADTVDVLVVGGGVTGAGIALDAATRGLSVGLVEAQDWASGTSSRSSKLVHGGLRYLQMLDFKLVREALTERGLLLDRLAPHLVRPVPFLYPLGKQWERPYVAAGIGLYDLLAMIGTRNRAVPTHRHLRAEGVRERFPGMKPDACVGAIRYFDGQVDDARLVIGLVRTAVALGTHAATRTEVVSLTTEAGRVTGALVKDLETGEEITVRAGTTVIATGVWTEHTQHLADSGSGLRVNASKGIHVVVDRDRIDSRDGLILQTDKSVLFLIPWSRYWVIGTTDTEYDGDLTHPVATAADIDYVLTEANRVLADPLTRDDVIGTWAGLRPLLQPTDEDETSSTKVSREHTVAEVAPGLVAIAGGKLTTYRVMAEETIDFVLGPERTEELPSETDTTPLLGAAGYHAFARQAPRIAARFGWSESMLAHLLHRYGSALPELVALVEDRADLADPLAHAPAYLRAEIAYGITHEGALHLEDLMTIRTRLTYEVRRHGLDAVDEIADLAADLLGWDTETRDREVAAYAERCRAEDAAADTDTDAEAARARGRAGDPLAAAPHATPLTLP